MVEFKHILCPVDLSDSSARSLAHAAAIARWYRARLTVQHVSPSFDPVQVRGDVGEPARIVYPASQQETLDAVQQVCDLAGVPPDATLAADAGDPAALIVGRALDESADLIVMGTHGRRGFRRFLLGSVAETVLHEATCPVLSIPSHVRAATAHDVVFKQILCPIDFSPASLQALGFALELARQAHGTVTVLSVIEWLAEEESLGLAHFSVPEFRQHLLDDARTRLDQLVAKESCTWCVVDTMVAAGRAHREVLQVAASKAADLIVMGSQGRGGASLAIFGSTTQQVVRGATCPVLTVRGASTLPAS